MKFLFAFCAFVCFCALANRSQSQTCSGGVLTFTGTITVGDSNAGVRTGLSDLAGSCVAPLACSTPAIAGTFRYDVYDLVNSSGSSQCYTVRLTNTLGCGISLLSGAYLAGYVPGPGGACSNFLANLGTPVAGGSTASYSFTVPNGQPFSVVVMNGISAQVCSGNYALAISPCPTVAGTCPTITAGMSGTGAICVGDPKSVTVTLSGGAPPFTVVLDNGGGTLSGPGPNFNFMVSPSLTTTYSVDANLSHDNNNCPITGSNSALVTVNPVQGIPAVTPTPSVVCANSSGNSARGPAGASAYSWTISNGNITSATNVQIITYTAGPSGNVGLTLRVSNGSGCSAVGSSAVPIEADATPPMITCPSNITVTATGNCPAQVTAIVSAVDNCPGLTLVTDPPLGRFPVGTNLVKATATDAAGNRSVCYFTVTVLPGPPPNLEVIHTPAGIVLSWPRSYSCYNLQTATALSSPGNLTPWTPYIGSRATNGQMLVVTNGAPEIKRFYRLSY